MSALQRSKVKMRERDEEEFAKCTDRQNVEQVYKPSTQNCCSPFRATDRAGEGAGHGWQSLYVLAWGINLKLHLQLLWICGCEMAGGRSRKRVATAAMDAKLQQGKARQLL